MKETAEPSYALITSLRVALLIRGFILSTKELAGLYRPCVFIGYFLLHANSVFDTPAKLEKASLFDGIRKLD